MNYLLAMVTYEHILQEGYHSVTRFSDNTYDEYGS